MTTTLWVDATHGSAGDMLLGALFDAGADLDAVRDAVHTAAPDAIDLQVEQVRRHGLRATRAVVTAADSDVLRGPSDVARLVSGAKLSRAAAAFAGAVFDRLAAAEAHVHGMSVANVHFHEVGALDSLADVIGCAAALDSLGLLDPGVSRRVSRIGLGGGTVRTEHGILPVPVPATVELLRGAPVGGGAGDRELCTPTGAALLATLATDWGELPDLLLRASGTGAGTADPPDRANVLRVVIGDSPPTPTSGWREDDLMVVETTVDDLDPRRWPDVLDSLVVAGALDTWLSPVIMRKGRPGHVLTALTPPHTLDTVVRALVANTTSLGVRVHGVVRRAFPRDRVSVDVGGAVVGVKRGYLDGRVTTSQPEFDDVRAAAALLGLSVDEVLQRARDGLAPPAGTGPV